MAAALAWSLISIPALADVGDRNNGFSVADEKYLSKYEAAHKAGFDVGRNLLDSAWSDAEPVSDARIEASTATLERWLNPPEPEPVVEDPMYGSDASASTYSVPTYSATGAPLSSIAACESGGDYSAVDPSGTYGGAYQFDQATWESVGGTGSPAAASPAEQDARAAQLYAERGSAPWPVCGQ